MKKLVLRSCALLALALFTTLTTASAQDSERQGIVGDWIVSTTVHACPTGQPLFTLRSINLFVHDGSFMESGAALPPGPTPLRTTSLGTWRHLQAQMFAAIFRFTRLNPDGTFATMATVNRTIQLNGDQWTATDITVFTDANGTPVSTVCSTVAAVRPQ